MIGHGFQNGTEAYNFRQKTLTPSLALENCQTIMLGDFALTPGFSVSRFKIKF